MQAGQAGLESDAQGGADGAHARALAAFRYVAEQGLAVCAATASRHGNWTRRSVRSQWSRRRGERAPAAARKAFQEAWALERRPRLRW